MAAQSLPACHWYKQSEWFLGVARIEAWKGESHWLVELEGCSEGAADLLAAGVADRLHILDQALEHCPGLFVLLLDVPSTDLQPNLCCHEFSRMEPSLTVQWPKPSPSASHT